MSRTLRVMAQILLWSVVGLMFAVPRLGGPGEREGVILSSLAQWWSWGLLSPAILALDRRLPLKTVQLARRVLIHMAASPFVAMIYIYLFHLLMATMGLDTLTHLEGWGLIDYSLHGIFFLWCIMVYLFIVGASQIDRYRSDHSMKELQIERLERSSSQAHLYALRAQLNPHFLFNTLNMISAQTERNPRMARAMIGHLGDMLRASLDSTDGKETTLQAEIDVLGHYLAIQKLRFGDRLTVRIAVSPEVSQALVPVLLLQPLVENSIQHGFEKRPEGGTIEIIADKRLNRLHLRVIDDGVGLPEGLEPALSTGLGLTLTRERVTATGVDEKGEFSISRRPHGGTEVVITLPLVHQHDQLVTDKWARDPASIALRAGNGITG